MRGKIDSPYQGLTIKYKQEVFYMNMRTVEINEDDFINMLWDRVEALGRQADFGDNFWNDCFDYLSEIGWLKPKYNSPLYIIDNIVYNGDICAWNECADNYDSISEDYHGDMDAWIEDNGYFVFGDYVVLNLGLN